MNNTQLITRVQNLLRRETTINIELLEALNEVHRRKLWLAQGHPTFHAYCVKSLRMSEDSAARRLRVAELLLRYPEILKPLLLERRVHMSGLSLLYAVITDDNAERLLNEASGKSRRQIEEIRARERPKPDISSGVRRQSALSCVVAPESETSAETPVLQVAVVSGPHRQHLEVRSPDRHAFRTMMSTKTRESLESIYAMAGKKSYEEVFADMVETFEAEMHRRKHAETKRPRKVEERREPVVVRPAEAATPVATSAPKKKEKKRAPVPAHVKRAVWERDEGRCTFVGAEGRCNSPNDLQFHHIMNAADGGEPTVENITLHCEGHNFYQEVLDFGPAFVAAAVARRRASARLRTGAESSARRRPSRDAGRRASSRRRQRGGKRRGLAKRGRPGRR